MTRTFDDRPAVREQTPLLVSITGPSGTGKTYSALRLATGIQRIVGGDIFFIDTEARRALAYAEVFKFRHLDFQPPFSPLDYLDAIQHCVKKGAKTLVIDSLSHEHEGPGGVLEWHEKEMGGQQSKNMIAWARPKAARRRLINSILQLGISLVSCFRAKDKIKPVTGGEPKHLGWMPIAAEEMIYEQTLACLLLPGANGIPTWNPSQPGEKAMTKIPGQFRSVFASNPQLSEDIGEQLAKWAAGGIQRAPVDVLIGRYTACDAETFNVLEDERKKLWSKLSTADKARAKSASDEATVRLKDERDYEAAIAEGEVELVDDQQQGAA